MEIVIALRAYADIVEKEGRFTMANDLRKAATKLAANAELMTKLAANDG